jgi:hypothetical protein
MVDSRTSALPNAQSRGCRLLGEELHDGVLHSPTARANGHRLQAQLQFLDCFGVQAVVANVVFTGLSQR